MRHRHSLHPGGQLVRSYCALGWATHTRTARSHAPELIARVPLAKVKSTGRSVCAGAPRASTARVYSTFLRNEHPSVSRALPPVGWQMTVEQPLQITTVCAWLKTVVLRRGEGAQHGQCAQLWATATLHRASTGHTPGCFNGHQESQQRLREVSRRGARGGGEK